MRVAALPPLASESMRHYARQSRAGNTQRAYAAQWRMFERWCATRGCCSMPAEPIAVAAYLAQRAEANVALATISTTLAAIVFAHKAAGEPFDREHS